MGEGGSGELRDGPEKRNDLPVREVVAHAAREAGALVENYYEGAVRRTHGHSQPRAGDRRKPAARRPAKKKMSGGVRQNAPMPPYFH